MHSLKQSVVFPSPLISSSHVQSLYTWIEVRYLYISVCSYLGIVDSPAALFENLL